MMKKKAPINKEIIGEVEKLRRQFPKAKRSKAKKTKDRPALHTSGTQYQRLAETAKAIALILALETRDAYKAGHNLRVADLACAIGTEMSLPSDQLAGIRLGSVIHDIGKKSVPAKILSKRKKLTEEESQQIKAHVQHGYDLLKDIDFPWPIARMVLEHHERMNGSGYPRGLAGDALLVESRILAVADIVDAIASHRPHRLARGIDEALSEIKRSRGILYDPDVVDVCVRLFQEKNYTLIKG